MNTPRPHEIRLVVDGKSVFIDKIVCSEDWRFERCRLNFEDGSSVTFPPHPELTPHRDEQVVMITVDRFMNWFWDYEVPPATLPCDLPELLIAIIDDSAASQAESHQAIPSAFDSDSDSDPDPDSEAAADPNPSRQTGE